LWWVTGVAVATAGGRGGRAGWAFSFSVGGRAAVAAPVPGGVGVVGGRRGVGAAGVVRFRRGLALGLGAPRRVGLVVGSVCAAGGRWEVGVVVVAVVGRGGVAAEVAVVPAVDALERVPLAGFSCGHGGSGRWGVECVVGQELESYFAGERRRVN
jgi:hypothetical protein